MGGLLELVPAPDLQDGCVITRLHPNQGDTSAETFSYITRLKGVRITQHFDFLGFNDYGEWSEPSRTWQNARTAHFWSGFGMDHIAEAISGYDYPVFRNWIRALRADLYGGLSGSGAASGRDPSATPIVVVHHQCNLWASDAVCSSSSTSLPTSSWGRVKDSNQ